MKDYGVAMVAVGMSLLISGALMSFFPRFSKILGKLPGDRLLRLSVNRTIPIVSLLLAIIWLILLACTIIYLLTAFMQS